MLAVEEADLRVLVVDDERLVLRAVERALRVSGFEVTTAATFEAALEAVETIAFDVALVDRQLGLRNGLRLVEDLRRRAPTTEMVIMSGEHLDEEGELPFLRKPFTPSDLLRVLTQLRSRGDHG